jgi:hypothetical protein
MSDAERPLVLTLLAALAIITGVFSMIRGGLMIFGGISQIIAGVGGAGEIVYGVLSLAVGVLALLSGINVMRGASGWIEWMKRYAIGLAGYNALWVIYAMAAGGKLSWLNVLSELAIAIATLALLKTSEDIKKYLETE